MRIAKIACLGLCLFSGHIYAQMSQAHKALIDDAHAGGRVIFISGISDEQNRFSQMADLLFVGEKVYFSSWHPDGVQGSEHRAVAGTVPSNSGIGAWLGQSAIIIYQSKGGSGSVIGVNPVARSQAIEALDVRSEACGSSAGDGSAANPYLCHKRTERIPDAGISYGDPALFSSPYNTQGEIPDEALSLDELANLVRIPIYGLAVAVPVTRNVNSNIKLNKATLSAIFAGNLSNWSEVDISESGDIVICRRTPGAGEQTIFNMYFGGYPCAVNSNVPADRYASAAWDDAAKSYTVANGAGGVIVIENATAGAVQACLDRAVIGGSYTTLDRDGEPVAVNFGTGGYKALGVLSLDSLPNSEATGNWQFRSLDGAGTATAKDQNNAWFYSPTTSGDGKFPTIASLVDATWDLLAMVSFNVPTRISGAKAKVLAKLGENAQAPAVRDSLNPFIYHYPGGITASPAQTPAPVGGNVMRAEYLSGDQCAPYSRSW